MKLFTSTVLRTILSTRIIISKILNEVCFAKPMSLSSSSLSSRMQKRHLQQQQQNQYSTNKLQRKSLSVLQMFTNSSRHSLVLFTSLFVNIAFIIGTIVWIQRFNSNNYNFTTLQSSNSLKVKNGDLITFHGGNPNLHPISGTCWCNSNDYYCMCNPSLAIDLVIVSTSKYESESNNTTTTSNNYTIWLVRRKDTDQLAVLGGFVMVGETIEDAVVREVYEEIQINITKHNIQLFGIYSDPRRDNRRHTISIAYVIHIDNSNNNDGQQQNPIIPVAADDVKDVIQISINDIEKYVYFADHKTILLDYRKILYNESGMSTTKNTITTDTDTITDRSNINKIKKLNQNDFIESLHDFANDIQRSVCLPLPIISKT